MIIFEFSTDTGSRNQTIYWLGSISVTKEDEAHIDEIYAQLDVQAAGLDEVLWDWPYLRHSDGPEFACPHGVGHSNGVHGCDGCCSEIPNFPKCTRKCKGTCCS